MLNFQNKNFYQSLLNLSLYLFVYYYFVRVVYVYYKLAKYISLDFYRVALFVPAVIFITLAAYHYFKNIQQLKNNIYLNSFLSLFAIIVLSIIYHFIFRLDYMSDDVFSYQIKNLSYSILNALLGFYLYQQLNSNSSKKIIFVVWFFYAIMLLINLNGFALDTKGVSGVHLMLGDTFIIISIVAIFMNINHKILKIISLSAVLILAYLINSRSSFFSFLVVYLFFLYKEIGLKNLLYLFVLMFFVAFALYYFDLLRINKRMFGVFQGHSDGSLNERMEQFKYGIEAIKNNWFFGEFAGQAIVHTQGYRSGQMGAYMHNWLSYYRQFGLVFFVIFTLMFVYAGLFILKEWYLKNTPIKNMLYYLFVFEAVSLLVFRAYSFTHVWLVMVMLYSYIHDKNIKNLSEKA
ncbi:MAG: hypothetical protein DRQ51_01705 [Gammaproteobacteria bacterium]|nr:MAG: hypothetical protein DRQ51_01705 [Gammaproteobacteria bacterium]